MVKKPTVISLFSGCGGSSLGYKLAGFRELLAIDFNEHAIKTFRLNFPEVPCWQRDIREIKAREIFSFCKLKKGELDVLDGSPPCQGFSISGRRKLNDLRNDLFESFIRIIKNLNPKIFVMENVPGMMRGKYRGMFNIIMEELKSTKYKVKCKLMNAMHYGVPQARERLIFIGVRNGIKKEPAYPIPSNKIITTGKAIEGVNNNEQELIFFNRIKKSVNYDRFLKMKEGEAFSKYSKNGSGFSFIRAWWDKPCYTISKTIKSWSSSDGLMHPRECRKFTITEIKRLSSFPDKFKITGSIQEQWAVIGNAVPPKMMQVIAETIKKEILN